MEKRIVLREGEYLGSDKEKRVTPFVLTKYGHEIDDRISKTHACPEAIEFALRMKPIPDYRIILVTAMGCSEYWVDNKKADTFPINALLGKNPKDIPMSHFDNVKHKIPKYWGIPTFPTKFNESGIQIGGGNTFFEHDNRVPPDLMGKEVDYSLSREPRCGYIIKSFWNPKLFRVEVIQTVSAKKLPSIVKRIDNGELIGISMACDVGFDRCTKCGNLATSLDSYCKHLKDKKLRGLIDVEGDLYGMANDFPWFFDSTLTEMPADRVGRMIVKIASSVNIFKSDDVWTFGNETNSLSKSASALNFDELSNHGKVGEVIHKLDDHRVFNNITRNIDHYRENESPLPLTVIKQLRPIPYKNLIIYMTVLSMNPTHEDLANLMFDLPNGHSRVISNQIKSLTDHHLKTASNIDDLNIKISIDDIEPNAEEFRKVANILRPFMEVKSYNPEYLYQRSVSKSASQAVDYSNAPYLLGRQAQAVLIARLLSEPDLINRLNGFLKSPFVQAELAKQSIAFEKNNSDIIQSILESNKPKYYEDRRKFYDS